MQAGRIVAATGALGAILALTSGAASAPDAGRGGRLFEKRCTGCHALDQLKAGPPLRGVFGSGAARDARFPYSDALKRAGITWNEASLDGWLTDPDSLVPGTDMSFRLDNAAERADIIAYLKRLPGK